MSRPPTVLIVDDDPSHLKLYSWIIERGGFHAAVALVGSSKVVYPENRDIALITLDYRLASTLTAPQIAEELNRLYPNIPIVVLSELAWLPADISQYAAGFISKGEPQQLVELISKLTCYPLASREG